MSKEIKSKKYQGVYFRELENGDRSYFLRFRLEGKIKRIPIGKKSEGITEAFCAQEKARIINASRFGDNVAAQLQKTKKADPTFNDLIDFYLESGRAKKSTQTGVRTLKKAPFKDKKKITPGDIQAYLDAEAKRVKPGTVEHRYRVIRMVIRYAIRKGKYTYSDPCKGIELPKNDTGIRTRYLKPYEVQRLLEEVQDKPRLHVFVKIALCTGARLGTIMRIHKDDIQPDGAVRLYNEKLDRFYTGFLDAETMELIDDRKGYVLAKRGKEDKRPGKHQIQRHLLKILDELFNDEDTPQHERVVIHTLRHSVATQQVSKGVPIEVVCKTLDHTSIGTTSRIYAKIAPELVQKSVYGLWD